MRVLDRDKGWRTNTSERHMRNHAGENLEGSNHRCAVCTDDSRSLYEVAYFDEGMTTQEIAEEIGCSESLVYKHMKEHFTPIVQRGASAIVSIKVGEEVNVLRHNTERLNEKLGRYMDEVTVLCPTWCASVKKSENQSKTSPLSRTNGLNPRTKWSQTPLTSSKLKWLRKVQKHGCGSRTHFSTKRMLT